jgi:hypothetical protein
LSAPPNIHQFEVELPAGGRLFMLSADEVDLWNKSAERYVEDYHLVNTNDLHVLGAILQQQILAYRSQFLVNGMEAEVDSSGVPTGRYTVSKKSTEDMAIAQKMLTNATDQIAKLEKVLGIDKASREAGGQVSVQTYVRTLKRAAHERGIHISRRILAYEQVIQDCSWRLRVMANADPEDRAYHDLTPEKFCEWLKAEVDSLAEIERKFKAERGALYVGQL